MNNFWALNNYNAIDSIYKNKFIYIRFCVRLSVFSNDIVLQVLFQFSFVMNSHSRGTLFRPRTNVSYPYLLIIIIAWANERESDAMLIPWNQHQPPFNAPRTTNNNAIIMVMMIISIVECYYVYIFVKSAVSTLRSLVFDSDWIIVITCILYTYTKNSNNDNKIVFVLMSRFVSDIIIIMYRNRVTISN